MAGLNQYSNLPSRINEPLNGPYSCADCNKSFATTQILESHQQIHKKTNLQQDVVNDPRTIFLALPVPTLVRKSTMNLQKAINSGQISLKREPFEIGRQQKVAINVQEVANHDIKIMKRNFEERNYVGSSNLQMKQLDPKISILYGSQSEEYHCPDLVDSINLEPAKSKRAKQGIEVSTNLTLHSLETKCGFDLSRKMSNYRNSNNLHMKQINPKFPITLALESERHNPHFLDFINNLEQGEMKSNFSNKMHNSRLTDMRKAKHKRNKPEIIDLTLEDVDWSMEGGYQNDKNCRHFVDFMGCLENQEKMSTSANRVTNSKATELRNVKEGQEWSKLSKDDTLNPTGIDLDLKL